MSSPNPPAPPANDSPAPPATSRTPRAGQVVTYRHEDTITGRDLVGPGIVVRVTDDGAQVVVAPLADLHLLLEADKVQPVKPGDIPTTVQLPEPEQS